VSDRPEPAADDDASTPPRKRKPAGGFGSALRGLARAAGEVATASGEEARRLAETARPEVERRAQQAKAAVEAATPHIKQAASDATDYVREHQDEIRRGAQRGAGVVADQAVRTITPGPLRPAIDAMKDELREEPEASSEAPEAERTPEGTG
jgi:ABC-type transporter Mla subunit MlaD